MISHLLGGAGNIGGLCSVIHSVVDGAGNVNELLTITEQCRWIGHVSYIALMTQVTAST